MLYCYLSDTALAPLLDGGVSSYDIFTSKGTGSVCQVDERVLSIFNVDDPTNGSRISPNIVIDPRVNYNSNNRILGLFTGDPSEVSGTSTERAVGRMVLHYDSYWAVHDNEAGNMISRLNNQEHAAQFKMLFNVIETCVLAHTYDIDNQKWYYRTTDYLNTLMASNSTVYGNGSTDAANTTPGYVYGTLSMPIVSAGRDKKATVQNRNTNDAAGTVKTGIGTNDTKTSYNADILFPDYIQFTFRFGALSAATIFRIYLNPEALMTDYNKTLITNVVCPASPADLVNLSYANVEDTLANASRYVANTLTHEVTKSLDSNDNETNHLATTNHSGASKFPVTYKVPNSTSSYTFNFTCIYKGRTPSISEMRTAVRTILEEANGGRTVKTIFPELYVTVSFIVVPMYNTRVIADTNLGITYSKDIMRTQQYLGCYNGSTTATSIPSNILSKSSLITIPGYLMHALVYPENYADSSSQRLDQISLFSSYQPIGTEDQYWGSLSDAARDLNLKLAKLVASQLNGYAPTDVAYTVETKSIISNKPRTYLTFICEGYSFSMMTKESFTSHN